MSSDFFYPPRKRFVGLIPYWFVDSTEHKIGIVKMRGHVRIYWGERGVCIGRRFLSDAVVQVSSAELLPEHKEGEVVNGLDPSEYR